MLPSEKSWTSLYHHFHFHPQGHVPDQHQRSASASSSIHLLEDPNPHPHSHSVQMMTAPLDSTTQQHQRFPDVYTSSQPSSTPTTSKPQQRWLTVDYVNVNQTLTKMPADSLKQLHVAADPLKAFPSEALKQFQVCKILFHLTLLHLHSLQRKLPLVFRFPLNKRRRGQFQSNTHKWTQSNIGCRCYITLWHAGPQLTCFLWWYSG